ncbi:MAG: ArnT family glycosyltransferase [Bacteroidota bacterium]
MSPNRFAARLYIAALILRLIPVLLARGLGIGLDDMFQYDMLARSIVAGNGYRWYAQQDLAQLAPYVNFDLNSVKYDPVRGVPTSFRAPLYPAFLALVYAVSGTGFARFFAARLAQAILLGAPLAPLTYLTGRRLLDGNERAARLAGWVVAGYPMLLLFPIGLGTENLFFLLLLGSFLALLRCMDRPAAPAFLLAGVLLGLTALTRSVILPFAGLAVLWAWFSLRERRGAVLMALAVAVTIAPWVIRNSLLYGRLTGIETSLGYNLYVGYHPQSDGTFTFGPSLDLVPILDDSVRDQIGTERAIGFIRQDPGRFIPQAVSRLGQFFRLELRILTYFYSNNFFGYIPAPLLVALMAAFGLPFALVCLSASLGAALVPRSPGALLLLLLLAGYLLPHVFILSEERFHLALVPFFAMVAGYFWAARPRFMPERLSTRIALVIAGLLIINWTYQFTSQAAKFAALIGPNGNHSSYPY